MDDLDNIQEILQKHRPSTPRDFVGLQMSRREVTEKLYGGLGAISEEEEEEDDVSDHLSFLYAFPSPEVRKSQTSKYPFDDFGIAIAGAASAAPSFCDNKTLANLAQARQMD